LEPNGNLRWDLNSWNNRHPYDLGITIVPHPSNSLLCVETWIPRICLKLADYSSVRIK
jgi:hypothetical protein